jgi:hypothetical protein
MPSQSTKLTPSLKTGDSALVCAAAFDAASTGNQQRAFAQVPAHFTQPHQRAGGEIRRVGFWKSKFMAAIVISPSVVKYLSKRLIRAYSVAEWMAMRPAP